MDEKSDFSMSESKYKCMGAWKHIYCNRKGHWINATSTMTNSSTRQHDHAHKWPLPRTGPRSFSGTPANCMHTLAGTVQLKVIPILRYLWFGVDSKLLGKPVKLFHKSRKQQCDRLHRLGPDSEVKEVSLICNFCELELLYKLVRLADMTHLHLQGFGFQTRFNWSFQSSHKLSEFKSNIQQALRWSLFSQLGFYFYFPWFRNAPVSMTENIS